MKALLDAGLLNGDCLTVTGQTVAENLADIAPPDPGRRSSLHATENALGPSRVSPCSPGRVPRRCGREERQCPGAPVRRIRPRVRAEQAAMAAWKTAPSRPAMWWSSATRVPRGPGMREMPAITGAIKGPGWAGRPALTDGRFSGGTTGLCGHVAPEAVDGGPIALVREGRPVAIDLDERTLDLLVDDDELQRRRSEWGPLPPLRTRCAVEIRPLGGVSVARGRLRLNQEPAEHGVARRGLRHSPAPPIAG